LSDQDVISELNFWKQNVHSLNCKCLSEYKVPCVIVYSDVSDYACGAFSCQLDNSIFHKMWTDEKQCISSTWRELKAVQSCLEAFKKQFFGKSVKWYTDSKNCELIIQSGSMKGHLHELAMFIFSICVKDCININIQWIPRKLNAKSDAISKIFDYDD
jgi:hypothetical protein